MNLVCSRCGADWKSDDGCSAACESAPVMAARIAELEADLERERIRLAACGVVAGANTRDSAREARQMLPEYRSASLDDVELAVDREIAERKRREDAEAILQNVLNCCEQHWIALDIDDHFARYKD